MELIVKLYSDKPSKIGIKYSREYQAVKEYEDILNKNAGDVFSLKIEMVKDKLQLDLISEQTGERIIYKALEYKIDHLKKLENFLSRGADLQFVHIFSKSNTLLVAKPFRSARFITLTSYEIIGPADFSNNF